MLQQSSLNETPLKLVVLLSLLAAPYLIQISWLVAMAFVREGHGKLKKKKNPSIPSFPGKFLRNRLPGPGQYTHMWAERSLAHWNQCTEASVNNNHRPGFAAVYGPAWPSFRGVHHWPHCYLSFQEGAWRQNEIGSWTLHWDSWEPQLCPEGWKFGYSRKMLKCLRRIKKGLSLQSFQTKPFTRMEAHGDKLHIYLTFAGIEIGAWGGLMICY